MFNDFAEALLWLMRLALFAGLAWGAWLCFGAFFLPERSEKAIQFEHFATFALLVLILSTVGGSLHAG